MSLWNKIKRLLIQEMTERLSWAFMAYTGGILGYYFFEKGINFSLLIGLICGTAVLWFLTRKREFLSWLSMCTFFFLLGLINITGHIVNNQHPVLSHPLYQEHIEATVFENRSLVERQIVILDKIHWQNPDLKMPTRIRVYYNEKTPLLKKHDKIKAIVSVYPPEGVGAQNLWFQKIGATGIANNIKIIDSTQRESISFSEIRNNINQRLFQILPSSQAEIAAPLITGEQKLVTHETYQIYRRAGIAHVLSVSGFHMALLATFLFFVVRGFCAFFPRIVLYYNTKKISTVIALIGTFLYLGISGFQIPAIRAFIMITFVFLGILIDRSVLSMRSLILAGMGMLLLMPQMLFSVSFQLSFTAVAVLIMSYNFIQNQSWTHFKKVCIGFLLLNICVTFALMPFILYHFHQITPYSILGNMIFSGVFSLFIMPLLFVGALMMFWGLDKLFFISAGFGLDIVRYGIQKIANFPYAEIATTDFSPLCLIFISFGIMLLCLMKTRLKAVGLGFVALGILLGIIS